MRLIIGGFGESKREYAEENYKDAFIIDKLHMFIKEELKKGKTKEEIISLIENTKTDKEIVLISDEIGNGVVPMTKEDREWRETTGRILTYFATKAVSVERIVCGIAVKLK